MKCQLVLMAAIAALLGGGCTSDDDDEPDAGQGNGDRHDAGPVDPEEEVRCPDDIPELFAGETSGSETTGVNALVNARVIEASALPAKRFLNSWTIELTDADGVPIEDARIVDNCAFMPVHGHGSPSKVVALDEPGRFELTALNFIMRGPWEVQLAVDAESLPAETARAPNCRNAEAGKDYLVFDVCVKDE